MQILRVACIVVALLSPEAEVVGAVHVRGVQGETDADLIREIVDAVADVVDREYFDRELAAQVKAKLLEELELGRYAAIESSEELAERLAEQMYAITKDEHLSVLYSPRDEETRASSEAQRQLRELRGRRQNYGAEHVEILPGNVGYLNFTAFYRLTEGREAIEAAMALLRNADALVIDMRSNRGGNPDTVVLLASYLFDGPERLLFDIVPREGEATSYYTKTVPESHRDGRRPVFVLTAAKTFSAGEGFAFILQDRGRAEVIGEVTAGAANPGRPYPVGEDFEVVVPNGRVRSAVSGRNWEGVGVIPDIRTTEAEALRVAHRRALERLIETTNDENRAETLRKELERISPR